MSEDTIIKGAKLPAAALAGSCCLMLPLAAQDFQTSFEFDFFQDFFEANLEAFPGTLNIHIQGADIAVVGLIQKAADGALLAVSTGENAIER